MKFEKRCICECEIQLLYLLCVCVDFSPSCHTSIECDQFYLMPGGGSRPAASLGLVSPGAATDGVTLFFLGENL